MSVDHNKLSISLVYILISFIGAISGVGLLDLIPINLAQQRYEPTLGDFASQGVGLINYFSNLKPGTLAGAGGDPRLKANPFLKVKINKICNPIIRPDG